MGVVGNRLSERHLLLRKRWCATKSLRRGLNTKISGVPRDGDQAGRLRRLSGSDPEQGIGVEPRTSLTWLVYGSRKEGDARSLPPWGEIIDSLAPALVEAPL